MSVYIDSLVPSGSLKDKFNSQMKLTIKAAAHTEQAYTGLMSYRGTTFKVKIIAVFLSPTLASTA